VVFQFAIAIAFTIATGVIVTQSSYLRHADLGFKRDGLILVDSFDNSEITGAQRSALLNLWRASPGVVSVTDSTVAPGVYHSLSATNFKLPGQTGDGPSMNYEVTGPDFLKTYGGRLIAGRALDEAFGQDESNVGESQADAGDRATTPSISNVMINLNAVKTLGFKTPTDAIGKTLMQSKDDGGFQTFRIVGVVDNIRFRSPRDTVHPTVYFFTAKYFSSPMAGVRYANADPKLVMERMQAVWRQVAPTVPFRGKTIENSLQTYYQSDDERGHLFTLGAVLAVAIGCLGLYGLASFNTARRVKEIGIRKTLGASTSDILKLLVGQFMRPVLLANLIAWPLAYVAMQNWLSGFDQKIGLSPLYFLAATLLTIVIAVGTVAGQAYAVARSEPAKALRDE
jgi:putative ABC transport system permease protein